MNNEMKHMLAATFAVAMLCATAGCEAKEQPVAQTSSVEASAPSQAASESAAPAPTPVPSPTPAPAPKIEITFELANEIMQSQRATYEQGAGTPGSFEEFLKSHPDIISDQSGRGQVTSGKEVENTDGPVRLMMASPENDLLNRERLAKFVGNFQSKTPDSIVILSSGDPIPLWITVYAYDGSSMTVQSCFPFPQKDELEWQETYTTDRIEETDTEWILLDDPMQQHRYPKYGYEPIPLGEVIGERPEAEVQEYVEKLRQEQYPQTDSVVAREPQTVDDVPCYAFDLHQVMDGTSAYTGYSFAVAKDLSRYYEVEQVNGRWVLQGRPKAPPKG